MLVGWMARRLAARSAVAGLAVGLAVLAVLTLWSTAITERTTDRVRRADRITAAWVDVFTHLTSEDAAFRKYLATQDRAADRPALVAVVRALEDDLAWIERHGSAAEAQHVRLLRLDYVGYADVVQTVLAEEDPAQLAGYAGRGGAAFAPLQGRVVWNLERQRHELDRYLTDADRESMILHWVMLAVVLIDGVLCVVSALVLIEYQHRAEHESASNKYKAMHDTLTGLPNRQMLAEQAERAIDRAGGHHGVVGLLLIDLDRFKDVNDTLGHQCGDRLLQRVASRLTSVSRQSDVVARLGGDEFAVLLPHVSSVEAIERIAERIRKAIQDPVVLDGMTIDFGASIGVAVCPVDSRDADELLQHADIAMYVAKRAGLGISLYNPGKDESDPAALSVLSELRSGIERGELVLHYQPKVDTTSLRPIGVEALVRWQHPERGLLPPGAFLPIIEATEFVDQLTDAVLRMAIKQVSVWAKGGRRIPVAVNITARSLLNASFPEKVIHLLDQFGVAPNMLTLELTESALITAPAVASEVLRQLRSYGVQSSIDDYAEPCVKPRDRVLACAGVVA